MKNAFEVQNYEKKSTLLWKTISFNYNKAQRVWNCQNCNLNFPKPFYDGKFN